MKKVLTTLVSAMMALTITGCSSSGTSSVQEDKTEAEVEVEEEKEESVAAPTEKKEVRIDEAVLYDDNGIVITAKSLSKGIFGWEVKLLIENNTETAYTVQARNTSVNGYMVETMLSCDVAAGKKANDELVLINSYMDDADIKEIADIETNFTIFDSETWMTQWDTPLIQIKTNIADEYAYSFDESGTVLYDAEGIKIVSRGLVNDSILGPALELYIANNTGTEYTVQARDVSINGFMVTEILSQDVMPGKKAITALTFLSSELEENDIEEVQSIECYFTIFDTSNWLTEWNTPVVTINLP